MNKQERQSRILQFMSANQDQKLMKTEDLAEQLNVSKMTIRRDFRELAEAGLVHLFRGGASLADTSFPESKNIGIMLVSQTGKFANPFFNEVLEGVYDTLREFDYQVAFVRTIAEVHTAQDAETLLQEHPISGLLFVGGMWVESIQYLKTHVPHVVSIVRSLGPEFNAVKCEGFNSMRQMVTHLVQQGRSRIGFISGRADDRSRGYKQGLIDNNLDQDDALCVIVEERLEGWTPQTGKQGASKLMSLDNPPDAIMCASDWIALGVLQWLHQHDFHVPRDIAVTGYDNISDSEFMTPALTTIDVHKQFMGTLAAERLIRNIEGSDEWPIQITTPTSLVIRESCGYGGGW